MREENISTEHLTLRIMKTLFLVRAFTVCYAA